MRLFAGAYGATGVRHSGLRGLSEDLRNDV
jgi:hypothetical protein